MVWTPDASVRAPPLQFILFTAVLLALVGTLLAYTPETPPEVLDEAPAAQDEPHAPEAPLPPGAVPQTTAPPSPGPEPEQGEAFPPGSQVDWGDPDFVPTLLQLPAAAICRVEHGIIGDPTDDAYYLLPHGGVAILSYAVRIAPYAGHEPGSLVMDEDVAERGPATDCAAAPRIVFADADANGRYAPDDPVYLTSGPGAPIAAPDFTTAPDTWTTRVTGHDAYGPGSLVLAGHVDLATFEGLAATIPGAEFAYHDADATGTFTPGDAVWVTARDVADGALVPLGSVRLV
jgi:hypothetical protein